MLYTIYQITNVVDGKIYIGKHQTKNLDDGYMGSGKILRYAIAKYGVENFRKDVLFQFNNEADMNAKEAELVTEDFCLREDTYNLCVGGRGGFGYINSNNLRGSGSTEARRQTGRVSNQALRQRIAPGGDLHTTWKLAQSEATKARGKTTGFTGRQHTEETKARMSAAAKARRQATQSPL